MVRSPQPTMREVGCPLQRSISSAKEVSTGTWVRPVKPRKACARILRSAIFRRLPITSSGGQVWNTSDRWGTYHQGGMLHLSWGRCTLHAVLEDKVGQVPQAATVRFPDLTFLSGSGEAAFSPSDGQLYVVGLNGWQTGAESDGSFQRVRYSGRPIHMPSAFEPCEDGIKLTFSATDRPRVRCRST